MVISQPVERLKWFLNGVDFLRNLRKRIGEKTGERSFLDSVVDDQAVETVCGTITIPYQLAQVIEHLIPIIVVRQVVSDGSQMAVDPVRPGGRFKDANSKILGRDDFRHRKPPAGPGLIQA